MNSREERDRRIRKFLDRNDPVELRADVEQLCRELARRDPDAVPGLLHQISVIASTGIAAQRKKARDNWNAMERAVQALYAPESLGSEHRAAAGAIIAQALFPHATCAGGSALTKRFFNEWLEALRRHPELAESDWARREGLDGYLRKALGPEPPPFPSEHDTREGTNKPASDSGRGDSRQNEHQ